MNETGTVNRKQDLGGRVALLDPATLDPKQAILYQQALRTVVPLGDKCGYETRTADGRLIGPFNSMLFSPEISKAFLAFQEAEHDHTSLAERTRQVVILSVGSVWEAPYELYAHTAEARAAGLDEGMIDAVGKGQLCERLDADERVAQRFALTVATRRRVDDDLFSAAQQVFDNKGVLDIIFLIAPIRWYAHRSTSLTYPFQHDHSSKEELSLATKYHHLIEIGLS